MSERPESVISMCGPDTTVVFCLDHRSEAVLTVIQADERLQSWWVGKGTLQAQHERYASQGLSPCEVPVPLQMVIDRRWPEIDVVRGSFS